MIMIKMGFLTTLTFISSIRSTVVGGMGGSMGNRDDAPKTVEILVLEKKPMAIVLS